MKNKGRRGKENKRALGYMRTSSASNVGADKDSEKRQREAIQVFADQNGIEIIDWFYDAAVSGTDNIDKRAGFKAMLTRIASNGVNTIIVETANRFARDLMVQETGHSALRKAGIELIAADSPQSFVDDTPTADLVRRILGAVAHFDKDMTVAKLKGARDRKSVAHGKRIEGRKNLHETHPEVVVLAKRLRRASPKTGNRRSFRQISATLANEGHVTVNGRPYSATAIKRMVEGQMPERRSASKG